MTDDLVKRLRANASWGYDLAADAADRIEQLRGIIAEIHDTNLRRDMNIENRTKEIDRLCKGAKND